MLQLMPMHTSFGSSVCNLFLKVCASPWKQSVEIASNCFGQWQIYLDLRSLKAVTLYGLQFDIYPLQESSFLCFFCCFVLFLLRAFGCVF